MPSIGLSHETGMAPPTAHPGPSPEISASRGAGRNLVEAGDGVAEAAFDGAVAFGLEDLAAAQLADVEAVDGRAAFGADLRGGDVQGQLGQRLRDGVEQADAVLGLDLDEGAGVGGVVVEADLGGDALAGVGLVERAGDLLARRSGRGSPLPRR